MVTESLHQWLAEDRAEKESTGNFWGWISQASIFYVSIRSVPAMQPTDEKGVWWIRGKGRRPLISTYYTFHPTPLICN